MRSLSPSAVPSALRVAAPLAVVAVLAAACASGTPASSVSVAAGSTTAGAAASGAALTIETHSGSHGTYLTDATGRTLYLWTADTGGMSTCSGGCAAAWPPVTSSVTPSAGSGVTAAQLGLSKRSDGTEQATYDGHPLYYFAGDTSPGQTNGEGSTGFGAAWWMVSPSGSAITTAAGSSSTMASPSSTATSGGSSGGW